MNHLWVSHSMVIVVFLSLGLITVILNALTVRRFDQYPKPQELPFISVLVPARNEQRNIEACVSSLLAQSYPNFEVIVLDDQSTDGTRPLLTRLSSRDRRLRVLDGLDLPDDWLGKHWACHQLYQAAKGELLLFTDADTTHAPTMLGDSVSALMAENADLVTAFPSEETGTFGEQLVVPVISFAIFSFLPIYLVKHLRWPALSVTIGQFMLFRRSAYEAIGGFEAVRTHLVDDVSLGRNIISHDFQWRLLDGTRHVTCRMYQSFNEVVDGFSKSIFAFFDYRILPFLLILALVGMAFIEPPLVLAFHWLDMPVRTFPPDLATIAVLESLLIWLVAYLRFRFPPILVLFYPISLALFLLISLRSMVLTLTGNATWKDRSLDRVPARWL
jgi:chlorobactene glucosyltransferase